MRKYFILMALLLAVAFLSVEAGLKFETYNASDLTWDDVDTIECYWPSMSDSDVISAAYLDYSVGTGVVSPILSAHDTLREYIVGLDTIITLHRIECDTNFTKFFVENDSTFVQIKGISCDSIFRVEYRDVWSSKVQVRLDSLDWQALLRIIQKERE